MYIHVHNNYVRNNSTGDEGDRQLDRQIGVTVVSLNTIIAENQSAHGNRHSTDSRRIYWWYVIVFQMVQ